VSAEGWEMLPTVGERYAAFRKLTAVETEEIEERWDLRESALLITGGQITPAGRDEVSPKAAPVKRFPIASALFPELFS